MNPVLVGAIIGGVLGIFILQQLLEWAIFKRVMDDPVNGKLASTMAAYVLAVALYFIANGPFGLLIYLPGALIVGYFAVRKGHILRRRALDDDPARTFD